MSARLRARTLPRSHVRSHVRSLARTYVRTYVRSYAHLYGRSLARPSTRTPRPYRFCCFRATNVLNRDKWLFLSKRCCWILLLLLRKVGGTSDVFFKSTWIIRKKLLTRTLTLCFKYRSLGLFFLYLLGPGEPSGSQKTPKWKGGPTVRWKHPTDASRKGMNIAWLLCLAMILRLGPLNFSSDLSDGRNKNCLGSW